MSGRFYITTPIYYPSNRLHIGHTYTTVAADALARYHRLRGDDTWFLTGTDEHGQKMERAAQAAGKPTLAFIDEIVAGIKQLWSDLHISYDDFIRTTEPRHEQRVQEIFKRLYDQGDIYKSEYEGLYCTQCEAFYTETQLKDGNRCPDHDTVIERLREESYFFRMSRYADALLQHIHDHPDFIQPASRRNEVIRFIEQGLEDLSVSRTSFQWGVPVPFDPQHVIYVWIDALANYITALDYPNGDMYKKFWPADVQLIGKDILRFHAIIWPALLMALGEPLPKRVFGHGWVLLEGGKMSKARGNVIDPTHLIEKYGIDPVRYFLLREVPFGSDGVYSEDALILRTNVDLANDLGNLLSRTTAMINRFLGGVIPEPGDDDGILREKALRVVQQVEAAMERLEVSAALGAIWELVDKANKYIEEQAPWDLAKDPAKEKRLRGVMYSLAESLRVISALLSPFLIEAPMGILKQLGLEHVHAPGDAGSAGSATCGTWHDVTTWGKLRPGTRIARGEPLFPRIEVDVDDAASREAASTKGEETTVSTKPSKKDEGTVGQDQEEKEWIDIATFQRLDLRVVDIIHAERVKGADRLLRVQVRLGDEERQVVAGIAEHYDPETLIGRQAVLVANLKPVRIRGLESQGMLLAAVDDNGLSLVAPSEVRQSGAQVH